MKTLHLEGVEYLKASDAAKQHGYTSDYVGQLCRGGKVDAKLVGRSWYVNIDSLLEHRKGRYRSNQKKTSEFVKNEIKKISDTEPRPNYYERLVESVSVTYENDEGPLVPSPVKVAVQIEQSSNDVEEEHTVEIKEAEEDPEEFYLEVENNGYKQPQTGTLTIKSEDEVVFEAKNNPVSTRITEPKQKPEIIQPVRRHPIKSPVDQNVSKKPVQITKEAKARVLPNTARPAAPIQPVKSPIGVLAPASLALLAGLAVASLLVGYSWRFETNKAGETAGYQVNLSAVIESIYLLK